MTKDSDFHRQLLEQMHDGVYFLDANSKISYWNRGAERITGYSRDEVLNTRCSDNMLVHVDEVGCKICENGCPLVKTLADGEARSGQVFLHHKQGHRVPVDISVSPIMDGQGVIVGAVEVFQEVSSKGFTPEYIETLRKAALTDSLTGLPNRRFAEMKLSSRLTELQRYDIPFGFMFVDIDNFKRINDRYGHGVGDRVLTMVGKTLAKNIRDSDLVGRWGGEEMVAILPHIDGPGLKQIAEKLRSLVASAFCFEGEEQISVTVTIGATMARAEDIPEDIVHRADQLMYQGKRTRNCVMTSREGRP